MPESKNPEAALVSHVVFHTSTAIIVPILVVALSSMLIGQEQIEADSAQWRQQTVRRAFAEVSAGIYSSWSEKYLARLGDSAAPEILKLVNVKPLTQGDAKTALELVNMSFAYPRLIRHNASRTPTNTLVLLNYLDEHVVDNNTKSKINSVRQRIQAMPAFSQTFVPTEEKAHPNISGDLVEVFMSIAESDVRDDRLAFSRSHSPELL